MPSSLQPGNIDVVLVRPRNPLNMGAAARAIANFGFSHLTVVDPYEPHWRDARSAVDSEEILLDARCTQSLEEAVAGATLVLGTGSLTYRKPEQPVISLPQLAPLVQRELTGGGRIALVFGPENHGLSREDLSWCHQMIVIPTGERQPSMNLGQAVAVTLYELATRTFAGSELSAAPPISASSVPPVGDETGKNTSGELDRLAELIEETMLAAHYSPTSMRAANHHDLRLVLRRLSFSHHDLRRALGLFRRILWRLKK